MNPFQAAEFLVLGIVWGASFLLMRIGSPEFGPFALIELRVLLAAIALLPLMWRAKYRELMIEHWKPIAIVGLTNAALPFCLLSYGTLYLSSGFSAILNATVPFFAAIFGYLVWQEKISSVRTLGLVVGFCGVAVLIFGRGHFSFEGEGLAIIACLLGGASYGWSAHYSRRRIGHLPPIVVAVGCLWAASAMLAPLAWFYWPHTMPSIQAWTAVTLLALACTAVAFVLYYRLIATVGSAKTVLVTFLIPVFACLWGIAILDEKISSVMLIGAAIVLLGVSLATGVLSLHKQEK